MKKQSGMSLVEVMMAIAISAILTAVVLQYTQDLVKMQMRVKTLRGISTELGLLRANLAKSAFCTSRLAGTTFDPSIAGPQTLSAATIAGLGLTFNINDNVTTNSTQIQFVRRLQTIPLNMDTYELHNANLVFNFRPTSATLGGDVLSLRTVPLRILVDLASKKIVSCIDEIGDMALHCLLIGGTYDSNASPTCKLPVFKNDCATGSVADSILATGFNCLSSPPNPPTGPAMTPHPPPANQVYVVTQSFNCSPASCGCPSDYPMFVSGGHPGVSIVCLGYQTIPVAQSFYDVKNCLALANTNTNCVTLGGTIIQVGFGPCYSCP